MDSNEWLRQVRGAVEAAPWPRINGKSPHIKVTSPSDMVHEDDLWVVVKYPSVPWYISVAVSRLEFQRSDARQVQDWLLMEEILEDMLRYAEKGVDYAETKAQTA